MILFILFIDKWKVPENSIYSKYFIINMKDYNCLNCHFWSI